MSSGKHKIDRYIGGKKYSNFEDIDIFISAQILQERFHPTLNGHDVVEDHYYEGTSTLLTDIYNILQYSH